MTKLPIYQVDAFTDRVFAGNPAAVIPLPEWLPDVTLQSIASENNLSETAFFVRETVGYHLRWFTPAAEVDLCGHATVATAHVLATQFHVSDPTLRFRTKSGWISVDRDDERRYVLDFPSRPPAHVDVPALAVALGAEPEAVLAGKRDLMAVFPAQRDVARLRPDFKAFADLPSQFTIVTAPADDSMPYDFVSRFFCPLAGVDEDPVTGSAHCTLVPYWASRLGKEELEAAQLSARGGRLSCRLVGDRVLMAGRAVTYLRGEIEI